MILDLRNGDILSSCGQNGIGRQLKRQESVYTVLKKNLELYAWPSCVLSGMGLRKLPKLGNPRLLQGGLCLSAILVYRWGDDWDSGSQAIN